MLREEHLSAPGRITSFDGHVRLLRTGGVCELQVCPLIPSTCNTFWKNRIHDALLTRLSNDDDMEKNLSTFASEMASSAMILGSCCWSLNSLTRLGLTRCPGLATFKSLILVDELGRGTSHREGVGISHAIAEALIALKVCFLRFGLFAYDLLDS